MQIVIEKLNKHFIDAHHNLTVINELDWSIEQGKSVAIVGKSGIGKSTLLHLLAGIEPATSGKINIFNQEITSFSNNQLADFRLENLGFVFQFNNLLPEFTAVENVYLPLLLAQNKFSPEIKDKALGLLAKVGLAERAEHLPGELSGGEQQRVAIARALINDPKIILADEPTGSLDQSTGQEITDLLFDLVQQQQITLIVATHSLELAERFDFVYTMQAGGHLIRKEKS